MPPVPLPDHPNLQYLRKEARRLQRAVRAGDPAALALAREHHPGGPPPVPASFALSAAQLLTARRYGFASWPALARHVEVLERYWWDPVDYEPDAGGESSADRFARLACLSYHEDSPQRWAAARRLLAADPELGAANGWTAAVAGDPAALIRQLDADPGLARRRGGPFAWTPLFYLAYSRLDPGVSATAVLESAGRLLDAGADPNEGYLWLGLPTPFTLLTGAFGHGEQGRVRQPPHPHSIALARLLLEAGADPNDGQALYNRMFEPDDDHLELLLARGLGTGDGGPWKARLGDRLASPSELVDAQLDWAVSHDQPERVALLVAHGAALDRRDRDGHTPAERAALSGSERIRDFLLAHGSPPLLLDGTDALAAAVMVGDGRRVRELGPELGLRLLRQRPWLIVWASARGGRRAVQLLLELGWDVNAYGRGDVPSAMEWQTPLHQAALNGDLELTRLLLARGADPGLLDARFHATPLDWAEHAGRAEAAALLRAWPHAPTAPPVDR